MIRLQRKSARRVLWIFAAVFSIFTLALFTVLPALAAPSSVPPSPLDPKGSNAALVAGLFNIVLIIAAAVFVIVEGLFTLHWAELRSLLRTKVYVTLDDEQCYQRRLLRDVRERGRSVESVQQQYRTTVRPMALRYIYPTREFADVTVSGNDPIDQTSATVLLHIRGLTMAAGAV